MPLSAKSKDFLGTEIMSRDVWDDYRFNFTSRNMYNSLRETYGSPIFGLVYPDGVLNYAIFGWANNNMFGQVTWSFSSFSDEMILNRYTSWPENMNNRTSVPYTDVAIIFSRSSRDWSVKNMDDYPKEIMGTGQFLSERHVQHTFILDDALTDGFDLSRYRVLLAPGMDCISAGQEELLTRFVYNGGTLFLTGDAGMLTPYGDERASRAFNRILTDEMLSEAAKTDFVVATHGKGRIVYASRKHAINEYAASIRDTGMVYRFSPDPAITRINEKILSDVIGEAHFKAISIPVKVLVTVYRDVESNATMVHLLNATGVTAKHGDTLPTPNPTWTTVEEDITFDISLASLSKAYYTSPDSEGHKGVNWEKTGENRYTITVPKGTLEKYGIVYLQP
ncbi:MAG: beta-galactosidase trimerization domain-containing protein [Fermentimonas sp.]